MTRAVDVYKKLISTSNRDEQRLLILEAWNNDVEEFFLGLALAMGPYEFGLEKVPEIDDIDDGSGTLTFDEFNKLAMALANQQLKGKEAKAAVNQAAMEANVTEWNLWYRKILVKSLTKHLPLGVIQDTLLELTGK